MEIKSNKWAPSEVALLISRTKAGVSSEQIAIELGRSANSVRGRMCRMGLTVAAIPQKERDKAPAFIVDSVIPTPNRPIGDIIKDQAERFKRKVERYNIKHHGIQISMADDAPYAILFMGDPHMDDDGCDLEKLSYDLELCRTHEHVHGACIGDLTNNWIRALGHLYAHQGTTDDEAKELIRWMVSYTDWLFITLGNHDKWSVLAEVICEDLGVTHVSHGAMFKIRSGDRTLTLDARHTHKGNSMYNPAHAQLKRNHRGSMADIIIGGHTHQSAYTMIKNGVTGMIGHAIRVGAYKKADEYADMLGLDDECISPSVLCVIDPTATPEGYVTVFHDVDQGVKFLDAILGGNTWIKSNCSH